MIWWGKDVDPALAAEADDARLDTTPTPVLAALVSTDPAEIRAELDGRRAGFTPEWTNQRPDDAGVAITAVFAEQAAIVAAVIDQLPTKARVEHLRAVGVLQRAPRPLVATLVFEVSPVAPGGVTIGEGFEVLGRDASGALIPFETTDEIVAVPAKLAVLGRRNGGAVASLTIPSADRPSTAYLFGITPKTGVAIYLGLDATVAPGPELSFGVVVAAPGVPPASSAGGLFPQPGDEPPRLAWEIFTGRAFVPALVLADETKSFLQSGLVRLSIPSGWRAASPPGTDPAQPLYWLRAQLLDGTWRTAPAVTALGLNMVRAESGLTIRDEVLETPVSPDPDVRRVLKLSRSPVLDGTLAVSIDEGGKTAVRWRAVEDLSTAEPDDRVFLFDPATGTLTFGDERTGHGMPLPPGFRNVFATYRVAVTAGPVAAGAITTLAGSAPFLTSVTNLDAAGGAADVETLDGALLRGPREIRARYRAVAPADYEVLALAAAGADIRRAHAVAGFHPRFPGAVLPGVVGVFVVGARRDDGSPPVPTDATLQAVSASLAKVAPRGAEVVAAAPVFHSVRVEMTFELRGLADATRAISGVSAVLDRYFDPVSGGRDAQGWPFGGTIAYHPLVRFVLDNVGDVAAIPNLVLVVDGVRSRSCADVPIAPHDLLWPQAHQIVALPRRSS